MGVHQTVILLLPSWFLLIVLADWAMLTRIKELVLATAFAMVGFSVHLYLPLRATRESSTQLG